jgi:hypothetical protein
MIRLLYGLTKELLRAMRRPELDDIARRLQSTAEDAAGQMGKKAQTEFNATKKAVEQEKRMRQIRDEEYRIMQEEEMAFNEWIPKGPVSETKGVSPELARYLAGPQPKPLSDKELVHELLKNYKKK